VTEYELAPCNIPKPKGQDIVHMMSIHRRATLPSKAAKNSGGQIIPRIFLINLHWTKRAVYFYGMDGQLFGSPKKWRGLLFPFRP
jgi:hypothetical protein